MTALAESKTKYLKGEHKQIQKFTLVDTVKAYQGGLAQMVISSGEVQPLSTASGVLHKFVGVFTDEVDNADDGLTANVDIGGAVVLLTSSSLTAADVGKVAYGTDDATFSVTPSTNTQTIGIVVDVVSATQAYVQLFPFSEAGAARSYTITNHTVDVAMDCNTAADAEICDVLGTLILDLINRGIIAGTVSA